jgi:alcohol dehydrogenase
VCGSDIGIVDHMPYAPAGMPQGHEGVGIVEAIGEGVTRVKVGDRVVSSCTQGCGHCFLCEAGDSSMCRTYHAPLNTLFGVQSDAYLVNSADFNLAHVPTHVTDRQALLACDIMSTGFAAIERGGMKPGQTVVIYAQGPVGLCVTAAAKHYGAGRIMVVESVPERIATALKLGADEVIAPEDAAKTVMERTQGRGADLAVEALGRAYTFEAALQSIRPGGTVSSVGVYSGIASLTLPVTPTFFHQRIVTTLCPNGTARLEHLMGLQADGKVDLGALWTHSMALSDIAAGYEMFRHRRDGVLKIAVTP